MAWMYDYLALQLQQRGIDSIIFTGYMIETLEASAGIGSDLGAKIQQLVEILQSVDVYYSDTTDFAAYIVNVHSRGCLLPEEEQALIMSNDALSGGGDNWNNFAGGDTIGGTGEGFHWAAPGAEIGSTNDPASDNQHGGSDNDEQFYWMTMLEHLDHVLVHHFNCAPSSFGPDASYQALLKAQGNVYGAVQYLLHAKELVDNCKPCRYMLTGKCLRADCIFEHDVSSKPCRYWLVSQCMNYQQEMTEGGNSGTCPFSHVLPDLPAEKQSMLAQPISTPNPPPAVPQQQSPPESTDFPDLLLGIGSDQSNSKANGGKGISYAKIASAPQKQEAPQQRSEAADYDDLNNWSTAKTDGAFSQLVGSMGSISSKSISTTSGSSNIRKLLPSEWVQSGSSLAADYATLREEASTLAKQRNKFLEEATKAYTSGGRAQAKALSRQGQELNDRMKAAHLQAAQAIFCTRNSAESIAQGVLDLHGLHVSEAEECLMQLLPLLLDENNATLYSGLPRTIKVVTGSGHHTIGPQKGRARLLPAVKALCENTLGYYCTPVKDDNQYTGGLIVSRTSLRNS